MVNDELKVRRERERERERVMSTDTLFSHQNKCFICGVGKTGFDNSQEYENHITQHHAMKNYM